MKYLPLLLLTVGCDPVILDQWETESDTDSPTAHLELGTPRIAVDPEIEPPTSEYRPDEDPEIVEAISAHSIRNHIRAVQAAEDAEYELWRIPSDPAELLARSTTELLRVCISEEGWANEVGCKAVWQTAHQIRPCIAEDGEHAVSCRDPRATNRRAPTLTGLWRFSPHVTGFRSMTTRRQRWTGTIERDCSQPSGWPTATANGTPYALWSNYEDLCIELEAHVSRIVRGTDEIHACPPRSKPIAWGCDPTRRAAQREVLGQSRPVRGCNDTPIARRRNLQRLNCGETENAYWCRPGTPHCNTLPRSERTYLQRTQGDLPNDERESLTR